MTTIIIIYILFSFWFLVENHITTDWSFTEKIINAFVISYVRIFLTVLMSPVVVILLFYKLITGSNSVVISKKDQNLGPYDLSSNFVNIYRVTR